MTAAPLLEVSDLAVKRGSKQVLHDISFDLSPREILCVIGPNGAGKSTLAKALLGLVPATSGRIERRAGLRIGYVPQKVTIEPTLPISVTRLMRLTERHSKADIENALTRVGAAGLADRPAHELSGGELQRVMLARALLGHPDLLILDEPTQSIDHAGQAQLYDLLLGLRNEGDIAIFLISHDLHVVMAGAERVLCLNGHVCCEGTPSSVARDPAFRALFGERDARHFGLFQHHHDHAHDDLAEPGEAAAE